MRRRRLVQEKCWAAEVSVHVFVVVCFYAEFTIKYIESSTRT
jgi:hypothetical protein